jgi:tetratricopeptide (TPR) repeat protein
MLLVLQAGAQAQFSFPGQASSPEEFDSYLLVLAKTSPKDIISATTDFEQRWPHSGLIAHVFELEAEAYASLGDAAKAILSNEKALDAAPDNLVVLANLAYVIANSTSNSQQLARAEEYARRELELSQTIVISKKISPQEWEETRNRIGSTAHASLGLVAYKRGDRAEAIREFEAAVRLEHIPDPAQYYRLGMLYQASGDRSKALEMLRRAAESDDPMIRQLAEAELSRIAPR